jgi:hypothetical protein
MLTLFFLMIFMAYLFSLIVIKYFLYVSSAIIVYGLNQTVTLLNLIGSSYVNDSNFFYFFTNITITLNIHYVHQKKY